MNIDTIKVVHLEKDIYGNYNNFIVTATISNNLKYIVCGGGDEILKIWDYENYDRVCQIRLRGNILICKFTDDSKLLYVGTTRAFHLFFVQNNFKLIYNQKFHRNFIINIYCISNTMLLTSSENGIINKQNTARRQSMFKIQAHNRETSALDYNKNHNLISSGPLDGSIKIWNGNDGLLRIEKQNAHRAFINQVFFISNIRLISSESTGGFKIWNIDYKKKKLTRYKVMHDYIQNISFVQNQYIITVGHRCIKIYSIDGNCIRQFDYDQNVLDLLNFRMENAVHKLEEIYNYDDDLIETATISNKLQYIVLGGNNQYLKIWDYETNTRVRQIMLSGVIMICKFTDDSKLLYVGTTMVLYQFLVQNNFKLIFKQILQEHDYPLNIYCISNTMLLTSSIDGIITKFNATLRQSLFEFQAHDDQIYGLDYNQNHNIISSASYDRSIKLWNANNGQLIIEMQNAHNKQKIIQVLFISNNQLISLDCNKIVIIWNIDYQNKVLEHYQILSDCAYNISLDLYSKYIITIGKKFIKVYTINGQLFKQFDHGKEGILDISYNIIQHNTMKAVIILGSFQPWLCRFQ